MNVGEDVKLRPVVDEGMQCTVERLIPTFGARITGVDLSRSLEDVIFRKIFNAFHEHSVVVFPGQNISPEQHIDFSRRFGELEVHVLKENLLDGYPEIFVVSNLMENGKPKGRAKAGWFWHSDLSYQAMPSLGSLLYAIEVPECGGDTMFSGMEPAYDALSDTMKRLLSTLHAEHDFRQGYEKYTSRWGPKMSEESFKARPPVVHPVIRTHPETGRKSVYVNPGYTTRIVDMSREESDALLEFLYAHCTRPEFVYRHRWHVGDLLMWDNRSVMHHAIGDYGSARRYMHRTTVTGDAPY